MHTQQIFRLSALTILVSAVLSINAYADVVVADDQIVQGSQCIGLDCVNNESFGFDTLRLKENNTRIGFDDTSTGTGFPANDWQLTANDSGSGGANYFSIDDITGGKVSFKLTAGAPTSSFHMDTNGKIGLHTSTPVLDLHLVKGDTPAFRFEQNNTSGYTAQTWDVAGNEANFFVRDVTGGSKLPFRIQPGAPTNTIYMANSGKVGFGTSSPAANVHVTGSSGSTSLKIEETSSTVLARELLTISNDGDVTLALNNTASGATTPKWAVANLSGELRLITPSGPGVEFALTNTGNVRITGTLTTAGTTCSGGCDAVFKSGNKIESIQEHAAQMWTNSYLPAVGPTVENAPFNVTEKTTAMLNELEKAHIYIEQLQKEVQANEEQIKQKDALLTSLVARLEKVEALVSK